MASGWTEREDQIIRDNYPDLGTKVCAALLRSEGYSRTDGAVKERAKNIGVKRDMTKITRTVENAWTKEELSVLKSAYPRGGAELVAKTLADMGYHRTVGAVNTRAAIVGVRRADTVRRMERKGKTRLVNICLDTELDADIIAKIDGQRNRSAYIRELVRGDIG